MMIDRCSALIGRVNSPFRLLRKRPEIQAHIRAIASVLAMTTNVVKGSLGVEKFAFHEPRAPPFSSFKDGMISGFERNAPQESAFDQVISKLPSLFPEGFITPFQLPSKVPLNPPVGFVG